ncbi:phosphatidylglycerol lysyltransferase domain-containing protein [Nocardioides sp.]|uniref:phosphatidylglycerol lysyltransferase domain-containing protein n=1 Tax=Nocardioides sp. TaxID=35761 RepID=UPI002613CE6B|nr:phosphatidylglycerol lysyltransferase domain-containing protein [Nocardioides sp.]
MKGFWAGLKSPLWVGRIVFVVGLLTLTGAYVPGIASRTHLINQVVPDVFPEAATTGSAAIGLLLMLLAAALRRGKYRAWLVALILTFLAAALHLLHGLRIEPAVLNLAIAALLIASRPQFTARPDQRSTGRFLRVIIFGPLMATALGWLWLTVDGDSVDGTTFWDRIWQSALGLIGIPGPITFTSSGAAHGSAVALAVLGGVVLILALVVAMQPSDGPHPLTAGEHVLVRRFLDSWGSVDSLAYFATRDDRSIITSPSGASAVSYRVIGNVSFAAGDPLGDPNDWDNAVTAWLDEARAYGWTPANLGCSERAAAVYHRAGLMVLEIGDEAVVHASEFTLEGRTMRGVRQAISRTRRAGISATAHRITDLPPETLELVRDKAIEWRDGPIERGFSMALGRFGQQRDNGGAVVIARDADGEPIGLLSFAPWGKDALSLDLMRRRADAENGVTELMVATVMESAEALGITKISLNFAAFRSVFARGERLGAGPVLRLWRAILLWASRYFQIESLYRANAKFRPEWVPRFLVYATAGDLPRVGTAALRAEALVVAPAWYRRLTGRDGRNNAVDQIPSIVVASDIPHDASELNA